MRELSYISNWHPGKGHFPSCAILFSKGWLQIEAELIILLGPSCPFYLKYIHPNLLKDTPENNSHSLKEYNILLNPFFSYKKDVSFLNKDYCLLKYMHLGYLSKLIVFIIIFNIVRS